MPRNCNVCSSPDRQRIETALAAGATFVAVSRESRFSMIFPDAIERHWKNHVAPELREGRTAPGVSAAVLAGGMAELLEAAKAVRLRAAASNQDALVLRAVQVEASVHAQILARLGIEPKHGRDEIEALIALRDAVDVIARHRPDAAEIVAAQVSLEHPEAADRIRSQFLETKEIAS